MVDLMRVEHDWDVTRGPVTTLEFANVDADFIDALVALRDMDIEFQYASFKGRIVTMESRYDEIDATTFGSPKRMYLAGYTRLIVTLSG